MSVEFNILVSGETAFAPDTVLKKRDIRSQMEKVTITNRSFEGFVCQMAPSFTSRTDSHLPGTLEKNVDPILLGYNLIVPISDKG
jgi:hypothetical protein